MAETTGHKRPRTIEPTADDFLRKAREMWRRSPDKARATTTEDIEFREHFGCGVLIAVTVWNMLVRLDSLPDKGRIEHPLWALSFMKECCKQKVMCSVCGGVDKETLMKWVWSFIFAISEMESVVIAWENRFKLDKGNDCLVTVDGTDFRVSQLGSKFSTHKFAKKSGLGCEVALCVLTGDVVWINGPCECGMWPDISIFRDSLVSHLAPNERVEADDGCVGEHPQCIKCPMGFANPEETEFMQCRVRSGQETVNKRFKVWRIPKEAWRHKADIPLHGDVFRAIAVITQLTVNSGERLFECGCRDPPCGDKNNRGKSNGDNGEIVDPDLQSTNSDEECLLASQNQGSSNAIRPWHAPY